MDSVLQSPERRSTSVDAPFYNGEASVAELRRCLAEVLPRASAQHEIILVNDGSRDRSWDVISKLRTADTVQDSTEDRDVTNEQLISASRK
jgi:cellulose synthase/poly-beta-1,6-N-acetylglucosamine synthase-like glycosyltransferase